MTSEMKLALYATVMIALTVVALVYAFSRSGECANARCERGKGMMMREYWGSWRCVCLEVPR